MHQSLREFLEGHKMSPRSYFELEILVFRLLEEHVKLSKKRLLRETEATHGASRFRVDVDGIAPDGIGSLPGPTLIEFKFTRNPIALIGTLDRLMDLVIRAECSSLLLICIVDVSAAIRTKIEEEWMVKFPSISLEIWGAEELETIFNVHKVTLVPLLNQLTTLRLRSAVAKVDSDWRKDRDGRVADLASVYSEGNVTLMLGAGVSIDAGLPDWSTLLDSLFVHLLTREFASGSDIRDEEIGAIVKRLRDVDDPSPLMTARYIRKGLAAGSVNRAEEFHSVVANVLYRGKRVNLANSWIKAISKMIRPRRTGAKIRAVVSYNFDDLLEKELMASGDRYRSIFREGDSPSHEELPIYHAHGFLPEDRSGYENLEESRLVFSEEGYHEIYVDAYHWSNLVQLNLLRDSTCIFVGLSLTDPNLRRLLEISARRSGSFRHFALMQRMSEEAFTTVKGKRVVDARRKATEQFISSHHKIKEELFRELGLTIIWFDDYHEVPQLISRIHS